MFFIFLIGFIYIFASVINGGNKQKKRNTFKYSDAGFGIPEYLISKYNKQTLKFEDESDLTFEEMEAYCNTPKKEREAVNLVYQNVNWKDIISWEYGYARSDNYSELPDTKYVWLTINTINQKISVSSVYVRDLKRYFKKYAKEKQIKNLDNRTEGLGIIVFIVILLAIAIKFNFSIHI